MRLGERTWPEVADRAASSLLAVPLGSTEQHGPHLPLSCDADVATALADRLAGRRPDVLVSPLLAYGASGEHAGFAGTLSIGLAALELVLVELLRSADAFRGVVLVNAHGGNATAIAGAVARSSAEGRSVLAWSPQVAGGDAHAGRTETSLLLALQPAAVRVASVQPGNRRPLAELLPELRSGGVARVSGSGVLGDPTGASPEEGTALVEHLTTDLVTAVDHRWPVT